jgi:HlyD family secretion protein
MVQPISPSSSPDAESSSPPDRSSSKSPVRRLLPKVFIPVGIGVLVVAGWALWYRQQQPVSDQLELSGRLEGFPTQVDAKVSGRIETLTVREGDLVDIGEPIAQLSAAELQAQRQGGLARLQAAQDREQQARSQLSVIQSQIREATLAQQQSEGEATGGVTQAEANLATAEAQLAQAQAQLQDANAQLYLARADRDRLSSLYEAGAISGQQFDQVVTRFESAQETVSSRAAAVQAAERQVAAAAGILTQAQSRTLTPTIRSTQVQTLQQQLNVANAQLAQAQADVANAEATVQEIEARLSDLTIVSPIAGIVQTRSVEPGTVVSPGTTLLTVIDPDDVFMRGFIPEGRIGEVTVGQSAQVFLDSFPDRPLEAQVRAIDPQASFTPENIYFREDRVRQVFGVELVIDNPNGFAKPGMPADAFISIGESALPKN